MRVPDEIDPAARFWDINRERSLDSEYWMANAACRHAINRRVTGDASEWPLDWLRRVHVRTPFRRGISWGCGLGAFERSTRRCGIVEQIAAFDVSSASLADARQMAEAEGLRGIEYQVGDFNDPLIRGARGGKFDSVFFHASLHHVSALERLFRRLALGLARPRAIYVDEYVGPSRFHWKADQLAAAQAVLDEVPASAKTAARILVPIEQDDPSEAFRSDEIPEFLRSFCDLIAWRPYGGQIVDLVFPCLVPEWVRSDAGTRFVLGMLAMEDRELATNPQATHYLVAFGHVKPLWRLGRPLGRQAAGALRQRLVWVGGG